MKERLQPTENKFCLGVFIDEQLMAMVTFVKNTHLKEAHKGHIYGMYVDQLVRGKGVGKLLLQACIKQVESISGLEQIHLTVVTTNVSAIALYKSIGFERYGTEKHALKYNEQYFDEDLMMLSI